MGQREENIPNQIANADGASQLRRERMEALKLKAQKRSRHASMSSIAENETAGSNRVFGLPARNCENSESTETPATKNLDKALCPPQAKKIKSGRGRTPMV